MAKRKISKMERRYIMRLGRMKSVYKETNTGKKFKHTWWQIGDFIFWQKKEEIK
jgi:hypothetical protein